MSNDISSLIPYLYSINSNNQVSQNPLLISDDDSDTDDSISNLGLDSIQLSPEALSTLNSLQASNDNNIFNSTLDSLVENNTITQDQEAAIKNTLYSLNTVSSTSSTYSNTSSQSPLDKLVSSNIITQDQEDSIKNALLSSRNEEIQKQAKLISENPILSNNPELYLNSSLYQQNNNL